MSQSLSRFVDPRLHWQPLRQVAAPAAVMEWLVDGGSLTRRLQRYGHFQVRPLCQGVVRPCTAEALLLGLPTRRWALVREVLLLLDGEPVVFARSVLPLDSLRRQNRVLGHMARRSLGAELFRAPQAQRVAVWAAQVPPSRIGAGDQEGGWGRQSLFLKRGQPLLVAEVFLPQLWQRLLA